MATIYTAPDEIKQPSLNFSNMKNYREESEKYIKDLKEWCINRCLKGGKSTLNVGEQIYFPIADGRAYYMVACMKPLQLIHIGLDDAYQFEYAHLLKAKDVQEKLDSQKRLAELFSSKKA